MRYVSTQSATSLSLAGWIRQGRHCAARARVISPAFSSTFKCLEIAGMLISKGSASSLTEASPDIKWAKIARRVGSASAEKVAVKESAVISGERGGELR